VHTPGPANLRNSSWAACPEVQIERRLDTYPFDQATFGPVSTWMGDRSNDKYAECYYKVYPLIVAQGRDSPMFKNYS
jgi:hypothetical protein